jgi:AcrR family transcriptional regulator
MPDTITPIAQGLRERKKQKTREAIQREATRLFQKQGYEETTIEQIAAAVDISPSTFFNYFPSKEDVVLYDAYDPMIATLFESRPSDEPLSESIRIVLEQITETLERDREIILARSKLFLETPELRARLWSEVERTQGFLGVLLAERAGREANDFEFRVVAIALVAAMMEAASEWARRDGRVPLGDLMRQALDAISADSMLDGFASQKSRR